MHRRVTPLKRVTSPTWGPLPPCKQALRSHSITKKFSLNKLCINITCNPPSMLETLTIDPLDENEQILCEA